MLLAVARLKIYNQSERFLLYNLIYNQVLSLKLLLLDYKNGLPEIRNRYYNVEKGNNNYHRNSRHNYCLCHCSFQRYLYI